MTAFPFLKRHPVPMQAYFENVLVLTYAFPEEILKPLMPPGLALDTYENYGFLQTLYTLPNAFRKAASRVANSAQRYGQ